MSCVSKLFLGGSWVVISEVINPLGWLIGIATLLITSFIPTHEPPSRSLESRECLHTDTLGLHEASRA